MIRNQLLFLNIVLAFLFFGTMAPSFSATEATDTITLVWEPGQATGPLNLFPVQHQRFFEGKHLGIPILQMTTKKGESFDWHFTVEDQRCREMIGDVELIVEHIATDTPIRWLFYNSAFHTYHQFNDPCFQQERAEDPSFRLLARHQVAFGHDLIQTTFQARKARFFRGSLNGSDFFLHADKDAIIGLHRLILRFRPISAPPSAPTVQLGNLLDHFSRVFRNRPLASWELKRYELAFRNGEMWTFLFLNRMLYSSEFRDQSFSAMENVEAIRRLFRLACGRIPTRLELNLMNSQEDKDYAAKIFVEKYYGEMVEFALKSLKKPTP